MSGFSWEEKTRNIYILIILEYMLGFAWYKKTTEHYILIMSNKVQQYASLYLYEINLHISGVHRTHHQEYIYWKCSVPVQVISLIWTTTFLQRGLIRPRCTNLVAQIGHMTCTRSCSYSFKFSWRLVRWTTEVCSVILQKINTSILLHLVGSY